MIRYLLDIKSIQIITHLLMRLIASLASGGSMLACVLSYALVSYRLILACCWNFDDDDSDNFDVQIWLSGESSVFNFDFHFNLHLSLQLNSYYSTGTPLKCRHDLSAFKHIWTRTMNIPLSSNYPTKRTYSKSVD